MKLTTLATRFLRMGATGFGGAMVLIGIMQRDMVERSQAVTPEQFAEGVAIGQVLPGPVAVDCATHLGYSLRGVLGAIVAAGGLILPSFLLMLILTPLYLAHGTMPQVAGFFRGVCPAVVAVILATGWRMGRKFVKDNASAVVAVVVAIGAIARAHPLLLILAAGMLGILLRWPKKPKPEVEAREAEGA